MNQHTITLATAAFALVLVAGARPVEASPSCPPLGTTSPCTWVPNASYPNVALDAMSYSAFAGPTPLTADAVSAANGENDDYWPTGADVDAAGDVYQHLAYFDTNASAPAHGKLLVFLPGTGGRPDEYSHFLTRAAHHGFNVIGLQFKNDVHETECYNSDNVLGCQNVQHRYDFDGTAIPLVYVTTGANNPLAGYYDASNPPTYIYPAYNSVRHRLVQVLRYLKTAFPDQGWDAFLAGPSHDGTVAPYVNWNLVTLAGHSHGGGVGTWMAQYNALDRLVMFNSLAVSDPPQPGFTSPSGPATFANLYDPVSFPNATHSANAYGFTWFQDSSHYAFDYPSALVNWVSQQLPGTRGNVDVVAPTTEHMLFGSHLFTSPTGSCAADPSTDPKKYGHVAPVVDSCEPGVTTGWHYSYVWDYMLGY